MWAISCPTALLEVLGICPRGDENLSVASILGGRVSGIVPSTKVDTVF